MAGHSPVCACVCVCDRLQLSLPTVLEYGIQNESFLRFLNESRKNLQLPESSRNKSAETFIKSGFCFYVHYLAKVNIKLP